MTRLLATLTTSLVLLAAAGCRTDQPGPDLVTRPDERRSQPPAGDTGDIVLAPEPLAVVGTIVSDLPGGAAGRDVVLLDGNRQAWRRVSDEAGRFSVAQIVAPYDVAVLSRAGGPAMVYLGIARADPSIALFDARVSTTARGAPSRALRLDVLLGKSPCAVAPGWVTVVATSATAYGSALVECARGQRQMAVDVEHVGPGAVTDSALDVHVLVEDVEGSAYAYSKRSSLSELEPIEPAPVGTIASVTVEATGETALLPDWSWMTTLTLGVGRATLLYGASTGNKARWALPAIAGAEVQASVVGVHPRAEKAGSFHRSTETWSGTHPLSAESIEVAVVAGPDLVRPTEGERMRTGDVAFEWQTPNGATTSFLSVWDVAKQDVAFHVVTAERSIARERLLALGVAALDRGDYWLELSASAGATIDDATSPEVGTRTRRFDRAYSGTETLLRIPFTVVE